MNILDRFTKQKQAINPYPPRNYFYCNDEYKIAFLPIHKCGISSIGNLIASLKNNVIASPLWDEENLHANFDTVTEFEDELTDYFTFAFIRNPFDRFLSFYKNWIHEPRNKKILGHYLEFGFYENMSFEECATKLIKIKDFKKLEPHTAPMHTFLYRGNKLRVKFIGKLENVKTDFEFVKSACGINKVLLHRNKKAKQVEYPLEVFDMVYEYYRKDYQLFGYERYKTKSSTVSYSKNVNPGKFKLICHFGYHKSMNAVFEKVLNRAGNQYGFKVFHLYSHTKKFYNKAQRNKYNTILTFHNNPVNFDKLPTFIGSHMIRDPRDLLISGYNHHLKINDEFIITKIKPDSNFYDTLGIKELGLEETAKGKSLQELLKTVDLETGLKIELNFRKNHFEQMMMWDFENPRIFEMRYEDFHENEFVIFEKLFRHYGFTDEMVMYSLQIVDAVIFKPIRKGEVSSEYELIEKPNLWREKMPESIKEIFREKYGDLLIKLGYENDQNW